MDHHDSKPARIRMGLLRQKQIQISTEKTPLIETEEASKFKDLSFTNEDATKKILTASSAIQPIQEHPEQCCKNIRGQNIVTLHRSFLLKEQSSSTSLIEPSLSRETSKESQLHDPACPTHKEVTVGFLLAILGAGVMYGLTGVFVRLADENGVGTAETLFVRSVFQSIVFGILVCVKQQSCRPPEGKFWLCCTVTISYALATITSFKAFNVIPPGNAITIRGAVRTIFAMIFAFLINREKVSIKDVFAIVGCVAGISCIMSSSILSKSNDNVDSNDNGNNNTLRSVFGYVLIVSAGITRSLGMVLVRRMTGELHSFVVVFYHSTLTLLIAFLLLFVQPLQWPPTGAGVAYTAAICATSSIATWSSNSAVQIIHPALVSMSQNTDMIVSIALGHLVLHLAPSFLELFGAGLVLVSVTGIAWLRWRGSKIDYEKLLNTDND